MAISAWLSPGVLTSTRSMSSRATTARQSVAVSSQPRRRAALRTAGRVAPAQDLHPRGEARREERRDLPVGVAVGAAHEGVADERDVDLGHGVVLAAAPMAVKDAPVEYDRLRMSAPPRRLVVAIAFAAFVSLGLPDGVLGVAWPSIRRTFGRPGEPPRLDPVRGDGGISRVQLRQRRHRRAPRRGPAAGVEQRAGGPELRGLRARPGVAGDARLRAGGRPGRGGDRRRHQRLRRGALLAAAGELAARELERGRVAGTADHDRGARRGPRLAPGATRWWRRSWPRCRSPSSPPSACGAGRGRPATRRRRAPPSTFLRTLRRPAVWAHMAVFFLYTGLEASAGQWAYSLLTEARADPAARGGHVGRRLLGEPHRGPRSSAGSPRIGSPRAPCCARRWCPRCSRRRSSGPTADRRRRWPGWPCWASRWPRSSRC